MEPRASFYRAVRHLETWSITLRPEQLGLIEGVRAAVAVSLIVLASAILHQPVLGWGAFGAFWTCLVDPGGSGKGRFLTLGQFAALGTLLAGGLSIAGSLGYYVSTLALFAAILLCGIIRLSRNVTNQVSVLSAVVAVVAVDFPSPPPQALILAGIFLAGSLFALLLCAIWRIHPYAQGRRAISAVYRELAFHARETAARFHGRDGADIEQARQRAAVREAIERARGILDGTMVGRNDVTVRAWLQSALEGADRIFAGLVALDHDHDARPAAAAGQEGMVAALQTALAEIERQVLLPVPDWSRLDPVRGQLAATAAGDDDIEGRVARQWAEALADIEGGAARVRVRGRAPIPADRALRPVLRHALRLAVTVALVRVTISALHLPFGYWATVAVVVVMQPETVATFPRMLERMVGSSIGGIGAALIYAVLPSPDLLLIAIFPIAAITIALGSVNYSLFVTFLSALFVLVTEVLTPGTGAVAAEARVIDNLLGAAFAMLGCVVLWPDPHGAPFRTAVEAALRANLAYAAEVLQGARGAAADDGRREAGMASNAAEMCLRRLLLQGRGWRIGSEPANHLLAELRRLTGMATAASMAGTAAFTTAIDEQVARCQDLAERWRASLK